MARNMRMATTGGAPLREARAHGERIARTPQFEWFARAGLVARGVVYVVIGVLALKLALGDGGKATNQQGALQTIAKQPVRDRAARSWSPSAWRATPPGACCERRSATVPRAPTTPRSASTAS